MFRKALISSLLATTALGAAVGRRSSSWTPTVGEKWQIILSGEPDMSQGLTPSDATVWDLDLFNTDASTISALKAQGKGVICYFSAGTYEPDRPDLGSLDASNKGAELPDWPGEYWLNIRSDNVVQIMTARVELASQKGCDAIDPDNMDGYSNQNGGGFSLTQDDTIAFTQKLSAAAQSYGMQMGLKNAQEVIPSVLDYVQFAVNEECVAGGGCNSYDSMLAAGKPVFHIEYPNGGGGDAPTKKTSSKDATSSYCVDGGFSTVLKNLSLDGYVEYCDGSVVTTPTTGDSSRRHTGQL